ncbi:FemAB family XrtA/PEP-CTERM system-associated protein [Tautonia rosea]|uniref:FemAB family XrtA/PEP-CTERM system-associated protein n=1 Tax=Tautonia rosea TaxID=2728037 RepID=UPI0019D11B36|nr:FemAB family XrtA/PEP-CTERM system-associated protein [Tautonia rosea]
MSTRTLPMIAIRLFGPDENVEAHLPRWESFVARRGPLPLSYHPAWPSVLSTGLRHIPYWIEATEGDETRGLLPLAFVRSVLFGRYLVGLPYLNYGGAMADDEDIAVQLIDRAIELSDHLNVRHLELRHEQALEHPRLTTRTGHKVHMRLPLPSTSEELWKQLKPSVRNQVRKGQKNQLTVSWGGEELLPAFYDVFSRNMRDLGTPVYGRSLFRGILRQFPDRSEICVVRLDTRPIASALLIHGRNITEVPSASSLRPYKSTCANMMMYWNLLERAVQLGQGVFDFGRSTPDGPTYKFKSQWGATPISASWQFYSNTGESTSIHPDHPRYRLFISAWRRLPVWLTRGIGPFIVRGVP